MAERNEPKATARHKQLAKSKLSEVEQEMARITGAWRARDAEKKKAEKARAAAEKAKTQEEVAKRKELIANYREDFLTSKRALKDEKAAKKLAAVQSKVSDYKDKE